MNIESRIQIETAEAKQIGRSSPFIRHLVLRCVRDALAEHYDGDYSTRCLQSSILVQRLLERIGIKSRLWIGALCVAEPTRQFTGILRWGGFWNEHHHVWVVNEFKELIDISIDQLDRHPACSTPDVIPPPPVWWSDIGAWPPVLKYLPEGPVTPQLEATDHADLEKLISLCDQRFTDRMTDADSVIDSTSPILQDEHSLNILDVVGHPWVRGAYEYVKYRVPLPDWIIKREKQLYDEFVSRSTRRD